MAEPGIEPGIEPRDLRSAVEFAVAIAREGQKRRPALDYPPALKRYLRLPKLSNAALGGVARVIEADPVFRQRLAAGAVDSLVDPIGRLWLTRPDGWKDEIARLVAAAREAALDADRDTALRRSDKRREAAEQAAARALAEAGVLQAKLAERDATIDQLRADLAKAVDAAEALRVEIGDARTEARHARDRERAARGKLDLAEGEREQALARAAQADSVRDGVLADRAVIAAERSEMTRLAASLRQAAEQLASLAAPSSDGHPARPTRQALPLPGGVLGSSAVAAEYLMRAGASVIVDGYNVSKSAWPDLDLAGQRVVLLDAIENLAKRFGSDITVVFDGADVTGARADRRRVARVVFSPDQVIADEVIRDEVRRLPPTRAVVVVTNDQQIVKDVRGVGANTMTSEQLLALMR